MQLEKIFNVGQDKEVSIMELAERIKSVTKSNSKIVLVPYDKAYEIGFEDMERRVPDLTKINNLIGTKRQIELNEMIERIWQSFKESEKQKLAIDSNYQNSNL